MQAADERGALRRAEMARENSSSWLRVRYRTADVRRRLVLAQAFELPPDKSNSNATIKMQPHASGNFTTSAIFMGFPQILLNICS
jgi:hypothetical protein